MIKSSSSDKIESPAKYFIRRQAQYFGGMALVHSTKLNRARWAQSSLVCGGRAPCGFVWARFVECVEDSVLDGIDPLSRKHGPEIYLVSLILLTKFIRFFLAKSYVKTFSGPFSPNHRRGKRMLRKMKRKLMRAKSPPKQRLFRSTVRVQQP